MAPEGVREERTHRLLDDHVSGAWGGHRETEPASKSILVGAGQNVVAHIGWDIEPAMLKDEKDVLSTPLGLSLDASLDESLGFSLGDEPFANRLEHVPAFFSAV